MVVSFYLGRQVKFTPTPDASGAIGFGAAFGKHWCYGQWPDSWRDRNIAAFLEFIPFSSACVYGK